MWAQRHQVAVALVIAPLKAQQGNGLIIKKFSNVPTRLRSMTRFSDLLKRRQLPGSPARKRARLSPDFDQTSAQGQPPGSW
jgi:hypothetical protein